MINPSELGCLYSGSTLQRVVAAHSGPPMRHTLRVMCVWVTAMRWAHEARAVGEVEGEGEMASTVTSALGCGDEVSHYNDL